mmetsp:Transcript_18891/g.31244  ORF Transcript_18891/g.31244 Transcript_18891/m.31244 type:complete len:400 (-) Transcript_18891:418-1617(-)
MTAISRVERTNLLSAGSHSSNLFSKVVFLLLDTFTDFNSGESNHLGTILLQQLSNGLIVGLDVDLRHEADFFQIFADTALHHLSNNFWWLSRFQSLFGKDSALLLQNISRHLLRNSKRWVHGSHVHGNISTELGGSSLHLHKDSNAVHVHVGTDGTSFSSTSIETTDLNVFTNLGNESLTASLRRGTSNIGIHESFKIVTFHFERGVRNAGGKFIEGSILGDKVSLAVNLDQDSLASTRGKDNLSLSGDTASLLVSLGKSVLTKGLASRLLVSVSLNKGSLTVHHTSTGSVTELLDGLWGNFTGGRGSGFFSSNWGGSFLGNWLRGSSFFNDWFWGGSFLDDWLWGGNFSNWLWGSNRFRLGGSLGFVGTSGSFARFLKLGSLALGLAVSSYRFRGGGS